MLERLIYIFRLFLNWYFCVETWKVLGGRVRREIQVCLSLRVGEERLPFLAKITEA